jgi:putative membrane-bound dehydrogenase-like protein
MNRLSLLCLGTCLIGAGSSQAQLAPEEALKKFTVADGLQIELFAAEPDVINPTSIDVDHKGRVWVCEAVNYRRKGFGRPILRKEGDRIVVLEDTKGIGKADKTHVFYQGEEIYGPIGIAVAPYPDGKGQKVFVCQSPDILVFEDKDGDLKADGPPKKFLTGFGGFDHDHGVHGINIGPDGKLYFTVGDQGVKNLKASDGKGPTFNSNTTDCRAGTVWRCDMDGTNLELIAHNFRNNYECCVNSFGEIWLSDNDDDGNQQTRICYVMPGGNYGYHPRGPGQSHWHEEQPGIVHKTLRTGFGSPTGICFYEGTLLPEKYRGQLLHTDAGPREFRCFHIKPKGAAYELDKELLVTSSDTWFRLSDVCVAPDGSVMLADWYDPGVGGHGMGDWTRGRIYRVTPKGHKGYSVPELKLDTKEGIRAALGSPCLATRSLAAAPLAAMDQKECDKFLQDVVADKATDPVLAARARWHQVRFHQVSRFAPTLFRTTAGANVDCQIVRILRDGFDRDPVHLLGRYAKALLHASSPATRRETALALRDAPAEQMKASFYELAKQYDGQDIFYRAALNIACGTDPARRDAILADFDKQFPEWDDKVADLVWELRPKSVMPRLIKLLADPKMTGAQRARIVDILAASEEIEAGQAMLRLLGKDSPAEVRDRALENLRLFLPGKWKALVGGKELKQAIDDFLAAAETRAVGLRLIAAAALSDASSRVGDIALNDKEPAVKLEAVHTLGKLSAPQAVETLQKIAVADPALAAEAITAIGLHLSTNARKPTNASFLALGFLQDAILNDKNSPATKQTALSALAGNQTGTQWLIDLHQKKQLPEALVADAGKLLRNSPYQGLRNRALLLFPAPGKLDPKKLPPIASLAKRLGNVEKGKQILAASLKGETQCLRCHTVRGVGGNIGPDLSMIGKKASKENLFESILLPSKAIADQYLQWQIENSAGQKIIGLIVEETPQGVTIRDANGKDTKIAKADIESRTKSSVSIMPEDIVKGFTEDELIDVVEYLFTLKTASLTPEWWHIVGPFDNDAADKGLDTAYEPEKAKTIDLGAAYKGKSGDVKWRTVRHNGGGFFDLSAHYGKGTSVNTASYLYREIESPVDQGATIFIGNDDGCKLWLNGEQVFENREHLAAVPERNKVNVKLKKGTNSVLFKIVNGNDPHGFYLSVDSEQELKLK